MQMYLILDNLSPHDSSVTDDSLSLSHKSETLLLRNDVICPRLNPLTVKQFGKVGHFQFLSL